MKRKILALFVVGILLCLSGCAKKETVYNYDTDSKISQLSSDTVAENDKFILQWNNDRKYISFIGKKTGEVWSTIPQEFLNSGTKRNKNLEAPINITVFNPADKSVTAVSGFSYAISSGRVGSEKITNGIKVTYYFDKFNLSIPVSYTLEKDFLNVSVIPGEIVENDFKLVSISIAPSFCSVKNGADSSYLFIPSGSGALMECYESGLESRKYSGNVYGVDKARVIIDKWFSEEEINLPVFGAKDTNSALFGIVDSYAATVINAESGNIETGFSGVYPSFELRGYDEKETAKTSKYIMYAEDITTCENISINYYLLEGNDSGYEKMSSVYRNYLKEKYSMAKSNDNSDILLTFYGGDLVNEFILGVPRKKLTVLTGYSDVYSITEEINSKTDTNLSVQLLGFTSNGLSKGKIAGGFKLSDVYGSKKDLNLLKDYIEKSDAKLYADFDVVNFNLSANGYNKFSAAKTANLQRMTIEPVSMDVHTKSAFDKEYYLLGRNHLASATDKLIKYLNKSNINGVSLESFGKTAYSDYADNKYYSKGNISSQINGLLSSFKEKEISVLVSDANDYAAAVADAITDVSFESDNYTVFDARVPFYQMVFSGYKKLYSSPANEQSSINDVLLDCVSTGIGMSFSISNSYDIKMAPTASSYVSKSIYDGNKSDIIDAINKYTSFSKRCNDASLISFKYLENGLIESIYDNGLVVYVNKSGEDIEYFDMVIKSGSFEMRGEE